MSSTKLSDFMREAFNWTWDEYVKMEKSQDSTTSQSIVFAVIRSSYMQQIDSIRIALNRLDGKLKTPVRIEAPKVYYLYPYASLPGGNTSAETDAPPPVSDTPKALAPIEGEVLPPSELEPEEDEEDITELTLREAISRMSDLPRAVPKEILKRAELVEQSIRNRDPLPADIPRVKSVVAASLLTLGQKRNIEALYEIFDQVEGKLTETIQLLGEDIYITSFASTAPPGALPNKDGILQVEATDTQEHWAQKLTQGREK